MNYLLFSVIILVAVRGPDPSSLSGPTCTTLFTEVFVPFILWSSNYHGSLAMGTCSTWPKHLNLISFNTSSENRSLGPLNVTFNLPVATIFYHYRKILGFQVANVFARLFAASMFETHNRIDLTAFMNTWPSTDSRKSHRRRRCPKLVKTSPIYGPQVRQLPQ